MKSVLQDWVMDLGLRHQGVLLTAVRGCDTAPKDDASKLFTRCYRDVILNAFCGDSEKSASFIEKVSSEKILERFIAFRKNCDHYPHHYVMHLVHAIQIVGYCHPNPMVAGLWLSFYMTLCKGLHLSPETKEVMDYRLNATEEEFSKG